MLDGDWSSDVCSSDLDGPQLGELKRKYPAVHFLGAKTGEDLAATYADADVFVFPSLTDTFGNVVVEALASGLPVAAFPVMGPIDIVGGTRGGILSNDLRAACLGALTLSRRDAIDVARGFDWRVSAEQFRVNLEEAQARRRTVRTAISPAGAAEHASEPADPRQPW
jgi:glycosyltransferase involved in cell wall biosynthesis